MSRRPLILLPVAAAVLLMTTGCSAVDDLLHRTHQETFADRAAAAEGWQGVRMPEWLPADATDVHNLATASETNAVIRVSSASALPAGCEPAERRTLPFDQPGWAPQLDEFPVTVSRCGDYEVMPVEGGWLGWFNASETGQTPAPALD